VSFWTDVPEVLDGDGNVITPAVPAPPPIDASAITPSVADVAALERTRTIHDDLTEVSTFDSQTRPSDVECQELIQQSLGEMLTILPACVDPAWNGPIRAAIALRAAQLVEVSYYREQAMSPGGPAATHAAQYVALLQGLQRAIPGAVTLPLVA
jgi:hypothetical protein